MPISRSAPVLLIVMVSTACGSFGQQSAVEVDPEDSMRNATWHASLNSPASLAGVVQIEGIAAMTPTADSAATIVTVALSNATPGGRHPWEARVGQCGSDDGTFGSPDAYDEPLEVGSNGRATASTTVDRRTPTTGSFFVVVRASQSNRNTIVACGNFAAPSG